MPLNRNLTLTDNEAGWLHDELNRAGIPAPRCSQRIAILNKLANELNEPAPTQFRLPRHLDPQQPRHDRGMTFEAHCDRVMQYWAGDPCGNLNRDMALHSADLIMRDQGFEPALTHYINMDWDVLSIRPSGMVRYEFDASLDTVVYLIDPVKFAESNRLNGTDSLLLCWDNIKIK